MARTKNELNTLEGRETRNAFVLSIVFFANFSAFVAIQNLQSSLNDTENLGITSLSVLYGCMVVSGISAPTVIRYLGVKRCILLSWLSHVVYTSTNFYPTFFTLIPSSIIVGGASGILWTCQGLYLAHCASSLAKRTNQGHYIALSKFNGIFFTFFEMTNVPGNLVSSLVLNSGEEDNSTIAYCGASYCPNESSLVRPESGSVFILMGIFLGCNMIAFVVSCFCISPLPPSQWINSVSLSDSLTSIFKILFKTKFIFLVPFFMFHPMDQAFVWSEYTRSYISCPVGIYLVGFVMAAFGATTSLSAFAFSRLAKYTGRRILFVIVAAVQAAVFAWLYIWKPTSEDLPYIFLAVILIASVEGIWQAQVQSLIALLFPENKEPAFATFHTLKSVTFTLTLALGDVLCVKAKLLMLLTLLGVGMILYGGMEVHLKVMQKKTRPAESTFINTITVQTKF